MNKLFTSLLCLFAALAVNGQTPYSYAPLDVDGANLSALGGNKNEFVQALSLFSPADDAVLARLKGKQILGVRCYLRADYKQARQKRSAILAAEGKPSNLVRTTYADFTEGWNDVLFDEPLTIGDQRIYLGLQAYETIGTPYPLVCFSDATVGQSCYVNLAKKTWEEYTDRGTLLVAALIEDGAEAEIARTAYVQNTTHPQTVAPDADFTGGLYVHNPTASPLSSLRIAIQGDGATEPTLRDVALSKPIPAYGSAVIQTLLRSGTTEGTAVNLSISAASINGEEAQESRAGVTSLYVTRDDFQRTPLVEEFTSQFCVNCPQMAYYLEKALEEYEGSYVYLSHHSGFREDIFTSQPDREITYIFGGYENEYNPAIMYNRAVLEGESNVIQGVRDMAPEPYLEALRAAADMPAMAEINIDYSDQTVRLTGRVAHDLTTSPLRISCYLVEDGISPRSYRQTGMDDDDAPADLYDVFRHNGVILHYFTTSAEGDALQADKETGRFEHEFDASTVTYIATEGKYKGTRTRVVAFVHPTDKDVLRNNAVLNAAQLVLHDTGVRTPQAASSVATPTFDLQGRPITSLHRPGIYITAGHKRLLR